MKTLFYFMIFAFGTLSAGAQTPDVSQLPITLLPTKNTDTSKAIIFYISGDGGENNFSSEFAKEWNGLGHPVIIFNTLKYFWSKKDPAMAARDVEQVIATYGQHWSRSKVILIGYSMGADILPFIYTRLNTPIKPLVKNMVMMSPSGYTDFEVHVNPVFTNRKKMLSVAEEIKKILKPILIVQGNKEEDKIEKEQLTGTNHSLLMLQGGHHYNANTNDVVKRIMQNLK